MSKEKDYWLHASRSARALFVLFLLYSTFIWYSILQADWVGSGVMFVVSNISIMTIVWLALWWLFKKRKPVVIPISFVIFSILLIFNIYTMVLGAVIESSVALLISVYFLYVTYKAKHQSGSV